MKQFTIDEAWELCLVMWKWISGKCEGDDYQEDSEDDPDYSPVEKLKTEWLKGHGYEYGDIEQECFLCHASNDGGYYQCNGCPAGSFDAGFDCLNNAYNFSVHPKSFYTKLKELNKIKLERKVK